MFDISYLNNTNQQFVNLTTTNAMSLNLNTLLSSNVESLVWSTSDFFFKMARSFFTFFISLPWCLAGDVDEDGIERRSRSTGTCSHMCVITAIDLYPKLWMNLLDFESMIHVNSSLWLIVYRYHDYTIIHTHTISYRYLSLSDHDHKNLRVRSYQVVGMRTIDLNKSCNIKVRSILESLSSQVTNTTRLQSSIAVKSKRLLEPRSDR